MTTDPFRILVVCTGNICRSPMAQSLLTHGLRDRLGRDIADANFVVESAGTHGVVGHPIEDAAHTVLTAYGVTPDPFEARELIADHVEVADLVLGATRTHRAAAVTLAPRASRWTFTLREFARLIAAVDPAKVDPAATPAEIARQLVPLAASYRGFVRPDAPEDDDIADPYMQAKSAFERAGGEIRESVWTIVDAITRAVGERVGS